MCRNEVLRIISSRTFSRFLLLLTLLPFGAFAHAEKGQPSRPVRVLRYIDPASNRHAMTTEGEGESVLPAPFQRESVAEGTQDSPFFYLSTEQYPGAVPLYRFRAADGSQRFVRTAEDRVALRSKGLQEITKPVFVYSEPAEGASEIFRMVNPKNEDLLYTTSQAEKSYLIQQGWSQQSSLGYTQSTSSSGTGHLGSKTVKLDDEDFALLALPAGDGSKLTFANLNEKLAGLKVGTPLYAPVKIQRGANDSLMLRPGFMRLVTSITRNGFGMVVETTQAKYKDLFHDIHLFVDGRPVGWIKQKAKPLTASAVADRSAFALTDRPSTAPPSKMSFDKLTEFHEPEYISKVPRPTPDDATGASLNFNVSANGTLTVDDLSLVDINGSVSAEITGEINFSAGCSDSIDLGFGSICDQWTGSGTVLFTPSVSASITASVDVLNMISLQQKIFEAQETFTVGEIPVMVTFDLFIGASVADQATETFSASALARGTGGFSVSLVVPEFWDSSGTAIGCPDPCPPGFSCGGGSQGYPGVGPTCLVSASAGDTIDLSPGTIDVNVWVTPQISAGPGIDDLSATVNFAVKNDLDFNFSTLTSVTGTYEMTPSIGYQAGACVWGVNIGESGSDNLTTLSVPIFSGGMPSATTMPMASSLTTTSGIVLAQVNPTDLATSVWFLYGTSPTLVGALQTTPIVCGPNYLCDPASAALTGLTPGATYYYEAVAKNSFGTAMGGIMSLLVPLPQTIAFPSPGNKMYGVAPFALQATASSGLPVSYTVISGSAMVNGNQLTVTGTGEVLIQASQAGNAKFSPATPVNVSIMVNAENGSFGSLAIGQTSPSVPIAFVVPANTTVGRVAVVTQGASGKDFQLVSSSVTSTGEIVNVTFTPQAPGPRYGAAILYDTSATPNVVGLVYLNGNGTGPQVNFTSNNMLSSLGSGFVSPYAAAMDGNGNIFVATETVFSGSNTAGSFVQEILAAGGYTTVNTLYTLGFSTPMDIAIDGAGNLFVISQRDGAVRELLAPDYTTANQISIPSALPDGVAVDASGNIFWANTGENSIMELPMGNNYAGASVTLASGLLNPRGVAVDRSGNVFFADTGNNAVKEILAAGGYTTVNTLGTSFKAPYGVALDGSGNVYVADQGNNAIKEMLAADGYATVNTLGSGFKTPAGVMVDASGNVYVADTGNSALKKLDFSDPPNLNFASTSVNLTNSGGPQTVTVTNGGNEPLTFAMSPSVSSGFTLDGSTTCPQTPSGASLVAGDSCNYAVLFAPNTQGALSGMLVLTDNDLNAPTPDYTTQSIGLNGTGLFPATLTAAVAAANKTYDGTTAATVTSCTVSGAMPSDTGNVACSVNSAAFAGANAGTGVTVTAAIALTGSAAGRYVLASSSPTASANIAKAPLTVTANNLVMPFGGTMPTPTFTYSGFVNGQGPSALSSAPTCTITATANSPLGAYPIACSGGAAANYAIQYVNGKLTISQMAQFTGTQFTLSASLSGPSGIAVDADQDIFVADTGNNAIKEIVNSKGYTTVIELASGFSSPSGVAIDSSGNVYVADTGNNAVKEILAAGGYTTVKNLGSGFSGPGGVAVDTSGNVYVADTKNNAVKEILAAGGYVTVKRMGSGFSAPTGVAVDGKGNVFVADKGNNAVKEMAAANAFVLVTTLGSGFIGPYGVAVDANGNVFVADTGNNVVKQMTAPNFTAVLTIGGGVTQPRGLAVDSKGNIYVGNRGGNSVLVIAYSPCFPAVPVGSSSLTYTYYFAFAEGGTIGAPAVLSQGAAGADFVDAKTGTCTTNGTSHAYKPGDTCSVNVIFTPKHPGLRIGSVRLTAATGLVAATAFVSGTGNGPQVVFPSSNALITLHTGFSSPNGVAVDANGNVFIADTRNNAVKEIPATGNYTTVKTLASGFSGPTGIAVDGLGNLIVADTGNKAVKEILASGGYTKVNTLNSSFMQPRGIAVDGGGNVFVTDDSTSTVYEILWGGLTTTLGSGFNNPTGLVVDANGNVFVADTGNKEVKEILAAGGYTTVKTLGSGFKLPNGVALDASGNVYVADSGAKAVKQILAAGGYTTVTTLNAGFSNPSGLAVDKSGNVFVSDAVKNSAFELALSKPTALTFASTTIGKTSATQTITLQNDGNAALLPVFIGTGTVPEIGKGFVVSGGTCVKLIAKGMPWLQPGASCTFAIAFAPQKGQTGTISGTLTFTDNHLNLNPATQSIALSGTGVAPTIAVSPTTATLPAAQAGKSYAPVAFSATGGVAPYTFKVSAGALPGGMTLSAAGKLSGAPAAAGAFTFTVVATDSNGYAGSRAYSLSVGGTAASFEPGGMDKKMP